MLPSYPHFGPHNSTVTPQQALAYSDGIMEDENVESDHLESEEEDEEIRNSAEEFWRTEGPHRNDSDGRSDRVCSESGAIGGDADDNADDDDNSSEDYDIENDEYLTFVRSVFFDDGASEKSGTDGDEDEDYNPETDPAVIDINNDDNYINDEYYHVTRKEVHDLVDASIHTLAGGSNTHLPGSTATTSATAVTAGAGGAATGITRGTGRVYGGQYGGRDVSTSDRILSVRRVGDDGDDNSSGGKVQLSTDPTSLSSSYCSGSGVSSQQSTVPVVPSSITTFPTSANTTTITTGSSRSNSTSTQHTIAAENERKLGELQKRNRLLSVLVSKMFAGADDQDIIVDDMPINNIRKLVARQMSMSLQLMIQMFLLIGSEDVGGEADRQLASLLMELSNLRDGGVRKTALLKEQLDSVRMFHMHESSGPLPCMDILCDSSSSGDDDDEDDETHDNYDSTGGVVGRAPSHTADTAYHSALTTSTTTTTSTNTAATTAFGSGGGNGSVGSKADQNGSRRRMTRTETLKQQTASSSTIFNIHTLHHINELFDAIDEARNTRDPLLQHNSASTNTSTTPASHNGLGRGKNEPGNCEVRQSSVLTGFVSSSSLSADVTGSAVPNVKFSLSSHANRSRLFEVISQLMQQTLLPRFCVRHWKCLEPGRNYPLAEEFARTVDPYSLRQRSLFTPAEDDLLLRGMVMTAVYGTSSSSAYGSGSGVGTDGTNWEEIKRCFLPSKESESLQFRMLQLSSQQDSKLQKYRELDRENRIQNRKWTIDEELSLLRGFQVFGSKWNMIKLYFLPHKTRHEIKLRWVYLVKAWDKPPVDGAPPFRAPIRPDGSLSRPLKQFLLSIQPNCYATSTGTTITTANGGFIGVSGGTRSSGVSAGVGAGMTPAHGQYAYPGLPMPCTSSITPSGASYHHSQKSGYTSTRGSIGTSITPGAAAMPSPSLGLLCGGSVGCSDTNQTFTSAQTALLSVAQHTNVTGAAVQTQQQHRHISSNISSNPIVPQTGGLNYLGPYDGVGGDVGSSSRSQFLSDGPYDVTHIDCTAIPSISMLPPGLLSTHHMSSGATTRPTSLVSQRMQNHTQRQPPPPAHPHHSQPTSAAAGSSVRGDSSHRDGVQMLLDGSGKFYERNSRKRRIVDHTTDPATTSAAIISGPIYSLEVVSGGTHIHENSKCTPKRARLPTSSGDAIGTSGCRDVVNSEHSNASDSVIEDSDSEDMGAAADDDDETIHRRRSRNGDNGSAVAGSSALVAVEDHLFSSRGGGSKSASAGTASRLSSAPGSSPAAVGGLFAAVMRHANQK